MKYSQIHTKIEKDAKTYDSINATYLIQGGFIDQTMSGAYSFLPLGLRVLNKIEQIVREEMDKVGVEVLLPALSPKSLWEQTGRLETVDVLMKTAGANAISEQKSTNEYILNSTHEEVITPIAKRFNLSYKDLPAAYYQIQSKFRNEARPKSGLLRGREFRMKDLYSFHASEADFKQYYENVKEVYMNVFRRLGLGNDTHEVLASGGDFTREYSHEFQTECTTGEDLIFRVPSTGIAYNKEVAPSQAPVPEQGSKQPMEKIETPNITGLHALSEFLKVPVSQCIKTMLYEAEDGRIIAAAVRGDYDINEIKLSQVLNTTKLALADRETVEAVTKAKIGYAGLINLPDTVEVVIDESLSEIVNFECGANETDYHYVNVNWGDDLPMPENFHDIKVAREGDFFPETDEEYEYFIASEVGNIFPLGTKFTKAFGYTHAAEDGSQKEVFMGSYGIGTSRLMGVIVEKFHDDKGIIWPESAAPFQAHLISLKGSEDTAAELHDQLQAKGIDVLWDDRPESAGAKFAVADMLGIPHRLVVSERSGDQIELKRRDSDDTKLVSVAELLEILSSQTAK